MADPRPGSEEEAANLALAHLRQPPIALLTEDSDRARAVRHMFASARDFALRKAEWNFATGWAVPAAIAGESVGPLKLRYPLPGDCLKVRFVDGLEADAWAVEVAKADPIDADVLANVLVTNAAAPLVCYTRRIDTPHLWDAEFLQAFALYLAWLAGPQLGTSGARLREIKTNFDDLFAAAAGSDAREKAAGEIPRDTSWIRARRVGGG